MSKKAPSDTPTVHFTRYGGRYVKADELLRSNAAREQIRKMADLARKRGSHDESKKGVAEDQ